MKVALLGNMNNNHFALIRYLRDEGIDADLLLYHGEHAHFHPSCDTYSLDYRSYVKQLSWGSPSQVHSTNLETIRRDLAPYDFLIGCGPAPAYVHLINRKLDIFVPYGADIWEQTFYRFRGLRVLKQVFMSVSLQRKGIPESKIFHMPETNDIYENQWKKYKGSSERWFEGLPIIYDKIYGPDKLEMLKNCTHWGREFEKLRRENDLIVFSHSRHQWTSSSQDPNSKGTDKLLKGLKIFKDKYPQKKIMLVTLEYGNDVDASKKLISELGISNAVAWFPKMYRKDLMVGLLLSDVVCAEFEHSWVASGVIYEAQVAAKPILAYRDDLAYYAKSNLYEIMNAQNSQDIAIQLENYVKSPDAYRRMGEAGREWYLNEVVKKVMDKYLNYFQARKTP